MARTTMPETIVLLSTRPPLKDFAFEYVYVPTTGEPGDITIPYEKYWNQQSLKNRRLYGLNIIR
jgi:hypothetical protein